MSNEIIIRCAELDDAPHIAQLVADGGSDAHLNPALGVDEAYIEQCRQDELSTVSIAKWREKIRRSDTDQHVIVALNGLRSIIGMHYSRVHDAEHGSIIGIYINRDYRNGGTDGAAQRLTDNALAWLGPHRTIDTMIATYNIPSQRFHHRNGFVIPGEMRTMGRIPTQLWFRPPQPGER